MSAARCCSAWNEPIVHAELLARLHVFDRHRQRFAHRADRLGGKRRDRLVDRPFDDRQRASGLAENVLGLDPHVGEGDLRRALAVLGRIAAPRDAGRIGVDQEEADPVPIAAAAAEPRRNDQRVRAVALADEPLLAVQHESRAVFARGQPDIMQIVARLPLGVGETEPEIARCDLADEIGPLFGTGAVPDQRAAEDDGLEIRFERQRLAEFLHHDHGLDRAAAVAAVVLREGRAKQAHLGVLAPQRLAPAARARLITLAGLETVPILHQPHDIVAQHLLLAAELKIHGQSPKMALAMIPRWISFDPP